MMRLGAWLRAATAFLLMLAAAWASGHAADALSTPAWREVMPAADRIGPFEGTPPNQWDLTREVLKAFRPVAGR